MFHPTIIEKRLNFSFVIPGRLAGMAMPGLNNPLEEEVGFLQRQKVKVLLNLGDMEYFYDDFRRLFLVIDEPIAEFAPPAMQQMERVMRFFMTLDQDVVMGVHCAGGVGRTGTILACLYGKVNEISGEEAIMAIRELRPGSIESASQEKFIMQYLAKGV